MTGPAKVLAVLTLLTLSACGSPEPEPLRADGGTETAEDVAVTESEPDAGELSCSDGPGDVFEERIRPLLEQDRPASCSKCHAAGVNLSAFVQEDACGSMACLVEQDLVDLESPVDSTLLTFIRRGFDPPENSGVTDEMVEQEYEGFLAWIEWSARCMEVACDTSGSQCSLPDTPLTPIDTPDDPDDPDDPEDSDDPDDENDPYDPANLPPMTLEHYDCSDEGQARAFRDWVFPTNSRCGHCHAKDGTIAGVAGAPTWIEARRDLSGAHGTIRNAYELGIIDLQYPDESLMLLKPLKQEVGGVYHGGGSKFVDRSDELYVRMRAWIGMQAVCDRLDRQNDFERSRTLAPNRQ